MKNERYMQVAYIGILNDDDTLKMGIPLYVKVNGEMMPQQEKLLHDISSEMLRRYEKQVCEYFVSLKKDSVEMNEAAGQKIAKPPCI